MVHKMQSPGAAAGHPDQPAHSEVPFPFPPGRPHRPCPCAHRYTPVSGSCTASLPSGQLGSTTLGSELACRQQAHAAALTRQRRRTERLGRPPRPRQTIRATAAAAGSAHAGQAAPPVHMPPHQVAGGNVVQDGRVDRGVARGAGGVGGGPGGLAGLAGLAGGQQGAAPEAAKVVKGQGMQAG